jgi:hypothetical protein
MKWEYKVESKTYGEYDRTYDTYDKAWVGELNKHGKDGWELIKVTTQKVGNRSDGSELRIISFYLKRLVR